MNEVNDLTKPETALDILVNTPDLSMTGEERANLTISCRDTDYIPKTKNAGRTISVKGSPVQVMHNGLYVLKGAYQGDWQAKVIEALHGNHEPQEEKVFFEVLKKIDTGSVMLELGAWWAYYSMWFLKTVNKGRAICCEPEIDNIDIGKKNMKLNGFSTPRDYVFYQAAAGYEDKKTITFKTWEKDLEIKVPIRTVDSIFQEQKIDKLAILHMDIQGAELGALKGAQLSIKQRKIRFIFVSTHHYLISGDPLMHQKCRDFIIKNGGHIITEHTIAESFSGDGLIVASFYDEDKDFKVETSLAHSNRSLFRQPEQDLALIWEKYSELRSDNIKTHLNLDKARATIDSNNDSNKKYLERLRWADSHPFRFYVTNFYHLYIKRGQTKPKDYE